MPQRFETSILSANDLVGGHTLYLTAEGWSRDHANALVATTPEQGAALCTMGVQRGGNDIIAPYLVAVSISDRGPVPHSRRERIRARGVPTISVGPVVSAG